VVVFRADLAPVLDPTGPFVPSLAIGASVQRDWAAGEERIVVVPWSPAQLPDPHTISGQVLARGLPRTPSPEQVRWEELAWKTRIDDLAFPGSEVFKRLALGNRLGRGVRRLRLDLFRNSPALSADVVLSHPAGLPLAPDIDGHRPSSNDPEGEPVTDFQFPAEPRSGVDLDLPPRSLFQSILTVQFGEGPESGDILRLVLIGCRPEDGAVVGGLSMTFPVP
jgi:hypothetical protein